MFGFFENLLRVASGDRWEPAYPPEKVYLVKVEEKPCVHLKYNSCINEKDALPEKKAKGKDGEIALSKSGKPLSDSQLTNMQLLLAKGDKGPEEIANEVGCSRDMVQRWKRKWIDEGKLPKES